MHTLWMDPEDVSFPALDGVLNVDLAILGAGFSGLGAAWATLAEDASIAVLEARSVGSGASGRNAGFVLAGPSLPFDQAVRTLGREAAREVWRFTVDNNSLLANIAAAEEIKCGFLRRGSMSLAASDQEWLDMRECCQALTDAGLWACPVEANQLPCPFDEMYCGGVYYPGNAELDPGAFLRGLARRLSVELDIYELTPVLTLRRQHGWTLKTPGGEVRASAVLLATNAYTPRILPDVPIDPRRGQMLATAPLPSVVVPFPMYGSRGYQYWRQTPDGRLVVGGWRDLDVAGEVGELERLHQRIQFTLDNFCQRVVGGDPAIDYRWAGIMGFTADHFPLVGRVPGHEDLWIAAGYSGHGVSMAFNSGVMAARLALGLPAAVPSCFRPNRFPLLSYRES